MYTSPASLVLGFHGCDGQVAEKVLAGKEPLFESKNAYDWLGHGIYFWEHNPERALQFAQDLQSTPRKGKAAPKSPCILGAVIDLRNCLNLLESKSLRLLKESYDLLCESREKAGVPLPKNRKDAGGELLLRYLDCAVIEMLHEATNNCYDSVRGVFVEGPELYENSGFHEKNHIQICVRNPQCIKGYFRPLQS